MDDVATFDRYSCFPIAVATVTDELGLTPDDPRGLTVTGGLPFFGGPGNDDAMHAIAETVRRARVTSGSFGLVGANGGFLSKYSIGVYSTTPMAWHDSDSTRLQAVAASTGARHGREGRRRGPDRDLDGQADRAGSRTGIIVGRLEDSRRGPHPR